MTILNRAVFTFLSVFFLFNQPLFAKQRCKPLLAKFHKIQQEQRQQYSLKRGISLREKEDKARKKWWACENTSNREFRLANKKEIKKQRKLKRKQQYRKQSVKLLKNKKGYLSSPKNNKNKYVKKRKNIKIKKAVTPSYSTTNKTNTLSVFDFSTDYEVDKLNAWQVFYQPPKSCLKPRKLAMFVTCSEQKKKQKLLFEKGIYP